MGSKTERMLASIHADKLPDSANTKSVVPGEYFSKATLHASSRGFQLNASRTVCDRPSRSSTRCGCGSARCATTAFADVRRFPAFLPSSLLSFLPPANEPTMLSKHDEVAEPTYYKGLHAVQVAQRCAFSICLAQFEMSVTLWGHRIPIGGTPKHTLKVGP